MKCKFKHSVYATGSTNGLFIPHFSSDNLNFYYYIRVKENDSWKYYGDGGLWTDDFSRAIEFTKESHANKVAHNLSRNHFGIVVYKTTKSLIHEIE